MWLVEEKNIHGETVWKMMSFFKPTELTWANDIKSSRHSIVISELGVIGKPEVHTSIKKYDSKRLTEAEGGL